MASVLGQVLNIGTTTGAMDLDRDPAGVGPCRNLFLITNRNFDLQGLSTGQAGAYSLLSEKNFQLKEKKIKQAL